MEDRPVYSAAGYRSIGKSSAPAAGPIIKAFIQLTVDGLLPVLDHLDPRRGFQSSRDFFAVLAFFSRVPFSDVLNQLVDDSDLKKGLNTALKRLEKVLEEERNSMAKLGDEKGQSRKPGKEEEEEEPKEPQSWFPKSKEAVRVPAVPAQAPAELFMQTVLQKMETNEGALTMEVIKRKLPLYTALIDNPEDTVNGTPKCFLISLGHRGVSKCDWICATSNATWGDFTTLAAWAKAARHSRFGSTPARVNRYEACIVSQTAKFMDVFSSESELMPTWDQGYFDHLDHEAAAFYFPSGRQRPRCPRCKAFFQWKDIADADKTNYRERYDRSPCSCAEVMIHNLTCQAENVDPCKLTIDPRITAPWTLKERASAPKPISKDETEFPSLKRSDSSASSSSTQLGTTRLEPAMGDSGPGPQTKWGPPPKPSASPASSSSSWPGPTTSDPTKIGQSSGTPTLSAWGSSGRPLQVTAPGQAQAPTATRTAPPATILTTPAIPTSSLSTGKGTTPAPALALPSSKGQPAPTTTITQLPSTVRIQPTVPTQAKPPQTVPAPTGKYTGPKDVYAPPKTPTPSPTPKQPTSTASKDVYAPPKTPTPSPVPKPTAAIGKPPTSTGKPPVSTATPPSTAKPQPRDPSNPWGKNTEK